MHIGYHERLILCCRRRIHLFSLVPGSLLALLPSDLGLLGAGSSFPFFLGLIIHLDDTHPFVPPSRVFLILNIVAGSFLHAQHVTVVPVERVKLGICRLVHALRR